MPAVKNRKSLVDMEGVAKSEGTSSIGSDGDHQVGVWLCGVSQKSLSHPMWLNEAGMCPDRRGKASK